MKLLLAKQKPDIVDSMSAQENTSFLNPKNDITKLGNQTQLLTIAGAGLGGLGIYKQAMKSTQDGKIKMPPDAIRRATKQTLGVTALGAAGLALSAGFRAKGREFYNIENPGIDTRLSPIGYYSTNLRSFANFRTQELKVDNKLVNKLELTRKEKVLGVESPQERAAQGVAMGGGLALAYKINDNNLKHSTAESLLELNPRLQQKFGDQYANVLNSKKYKFVRALEKHPLTAAIPLVAGVAIAGNIGRNALKNRAQKKTDEYLNASGANFNLITSDAYALGNVTDGEKRLQTMGSVGLGAGAIGAVLSRNEYYTDKIEAAPGYTAQKRAGASGLQNLAERDLSMPFNSKLLPGKVDKLYNLKRRITKNAMPLASVAAIGTGLALSGKAANDSYQRHLQTQAQLYAQDKRK